MFIIKNIKNEFSYSLIVFLVYEVYEEVYQAVDAK